MCNLKVRALPFCLSSSPRVFTKVFAAALEPLRLEGVAVVLSLRQLATFCGVQGTSSSQPESNPKAPDQFELAAESTSQLSSQLSE